jgi:hypothetical protein
MPSTAKRKSKIKSHHTQNRGTTSERQEGKSIDVVSFIHVEYLLTTIIEY